MGVAAYPRDVTDWPERTQIIRHFKHCYQDNKPSARMHDKCTNLPDVMYRAFPAGTSMLATVELSNPNSSVLLAGSRSNCNQLAGRFVLPATFLRTPTPSFSFVDSLRLSSE